MFVVQGADVIFGAGGATGQGALLAAAQAGQSCIGIGASDASAPGCLLTSTVKFIDGAVWATIIDAAAGRWSGGPRALCLAQIAVGLAPPPRPVPSGTPRPLHGHSHP